MSSLGDTDFAIAQLRHLYKQLLTGSVKDQRSAAQGLLGPAIVRLESYLEAEERRMSCVQWAERA